VDGIDFDAHSVETARRKRGLSGVHRVSLAEFVTECGTKHVRFDTVTFFEVLEHQDHPRAFMEDIKTLIRERGWIAGSVPNRDRLFPYVDRKGEFTGDLPPHHLLWFSRRALKNLLVREGFQDIVIHPVAQIEALIGLLEAVVTRSTPFLWRVRESMKYGSAGAARPEAADLGRPSVREAGAGAARWLKAARRLFFLLPALVLYPEFRRRGGYQLYFQARVKD
jgi:SAM-dependent methyltransferase